MATWVEDSYLGTQIVDEGRRCGPVAVAKKPLDAVLEVVFAKQAHHAPDDVAVAVEKCSRRDRVAEFELLHVIDSRANPHRKIELLLFRERPDLLDGGRIINGRGDHHDAIAVAFPFLSEQGQLFLAGNAPRGPKVEDDDLAPVLGQLLHLAVKVPQTQFRRRVCCSRAPERCESEIRRNGTNFED